MRLANPAALWLSLLALPVLALHILRPRRPPVEVSSTFLWREVARPVSVARPWQRLRPSVLLLLQLLMVALLAVAVARPVKVTAAPLSPHTVFIVDASGSMLAADGDPDRLEAAKARARELRSELPSGGVASVVVADHQPRVILSASSDRRAFDEAVRAIGAVPGPADFPTAFNLAQSVETPGTPIGFVILSDGGVGDDGSRYLPPGARYERIGSESTNRAITRLYVETRGSALHARVSVRNTGGPRATQTLRIDVDGRTAQEVRVHLEPGESADVEVDLPAGERVDAYLEGEDLLSADNHAVAVAERRRDLRVLWAGPENVFLDRLFSVVGGLEVERATEARPAPGFDVAVYDRVEVPADPAAPFLAIAPPGGLIGAPVEAVTDNPAVTLVRTDHPVLAGLDLSRVAIASAQRVQAPGDEVLVGAEATPLLISGDRGGRSFAYLTFSLADSNLPLQLAFPVLGDRLLADLAGASPAGADVRVGEALPSDIAFAATIDAPGGRQMSLAPGAPPPIADQVGYWTVRGEGRPDRTFAVNAAVAESSLAPAEALPVPERPAAEGERQLGGERPIIGWLAAAGLVLLAAEMVASRARRGVPRRQWRVAMAARLAVAALLLGALAGLSITREGRDVATLFLIDGSDSMGSVGRSAAAGWVREALDGQPGGSRAGVALYGGDARLELTVQERARLDVPAAQIDASRTNLAGALRLAEAVLPSDSRRRVVVLSDGRANEGDAASEAERLRSRGVQVDVVAVVDAAGGPDVAVERLDVPSQVREGEAFGVRATLVAAEAGPALLRWSRDGETVEERVVDIPAGTSVVELDAEAGEAGRLSRFSVEVSRTGDPVPENDVGFAGVRVDGPPRVLVVEGMPGEGDALAQALRAGAVPTDLVGVGSLPPFDELATYQSVVLVDVDNRSLAGDQVADLGALTRDLGRGLVVVGGDRAYGLGGYLGSELEKLLPVESDVSDPQRRPSVAQVLAIDASGSMGACHCAGPEGGPNGLAGGGNRAGGGVNKTDISRAAAARTISALSGSDHVGVLAFNTEQNWIVPLQQLPAEQVVTEGLRRLSPLGGTDLTEPLLQAGEALKETNASLRHIILFTDGFTSQQGLATLHEQAAELASQGITVSVLATGETGAEENLARVAEAGNGRFYNETDLAEVPQLMVQEALLASRSLLNEGEFYPIVVSSAEAVSGLDRSPPLLGYVATTAKPTAQVHLRVGTEEDPLLASWQVGLGRVTSWTSDASARWSQQWASWDGYTSFWSTVVKDTFPLSGADGSLQAEVAGGRLRLVVESPDRWPDGATARARVAAPDGSSTEIALDRVSAGQFAGEVAATAAGSYAVGAAVEAPGRESFAASTVAARSYSAEYAPGDPDPAALIRVSELSGGRGEIVPTQAFDVADLRPGARRLPLAGWLFLAAALLWPIAVALSRLALHGAGVAAVRRRGSRLAAIARRALSRGKRPPATPPRPKAPRRVRREKVGTATTPATPPPTVERLLRRKRGE